MIFIVTVVVMLTRNAMSGLFSLRLSALLVF